MSLHEHKPVYLGYRYLPPRSMMEIAHLSLRGRTLIWKCLECGERLEGARVEDMKNLQRPDFRPDAKARFGWSIDLKASEKKQLGQTKL